MVQVLPYVPGFGEKLASSFGQAATSAVQGYQQGQQKKQDQAILDAFDPNASMMDQIRQFGKLSPERQKTLTPLYSQFLKNQKLSEKQITAQEEKGAIESSLKRLDELLPTIAVDYTAQPFDLFNQQDVQNAEEFDANGLWTTDKAFAKFNKGTMSQAKLDLLVEKLAPNSRHTVRENKARIDSLKRIMGLPANATEKQIEAAAKEPSGSKAAPGTVRMISPDGQEVDIPKNMVKQAVAAGAKQI